MATARDELGRVTTRASSAYPVVFTCARSRDYATKLLRTKKVYVEDGVKISYHKFPEDKGLSKKWIIAIRRDIGQHF